MDAGYRAARSSAFEVEADAVDEREVVGKLNRNLVPLLFCLGIVCYVDRTNLSFAAIQLNRDLALSCSVYGLGAGIFFLSYALFQPVSNLILARVGAPLWLSATVVAWGVVAASFSLINGPTAFLILRFALGATEAGTFPGIWAALARFFTPQELGLAYAKVATSTALAQVLGAPLAALILSADGFLGLPGWKMLFITEGVATIAFGVALRFLLPPSPAEAMFLRPEERVWLQRRQDEEPGAASHKGTTRSELAALLKVFTDWRILYLAATLVCMITSMYSIVFFGPMMIHGMFSPPEQPPAGGPLLPAAGATKSCSGEGGGGGSGAAVALLSMAPFAAAAAAMVLNAKHAEAQNERHLHVGVPIAIGAVFMAMTPIMLEHVAPLAAFICLVLAAAAVWAFHGPFMSWPAVFLSGPEAPAGFAAMNAVGSLGGVVGPSLLGFLKDRFDSYAASMFVLAGLLALASAAIVLFPVPGARQPSVVVLDEEEEIWSGEPIGAAHLGKDGPGMERRPLFP